jgi:hypothetical protein
MAVIEVREDKRQGLATNLTVVLAVAVGERAKWTTSIIV